MSDPNERKRLAEWERALDDQATRDRIERAIARLDVRRRWLLGFLQLLAGLSLASAAWVAADSDWAAFALFVLMATVLMEGYGMVLLSKRVHDLEMGRSGLKVTLAVERLPDEAPRASSDERAH